MEDSQLGPKVEKLDDSEAAIEKATMKKFGTKTAKPKADPKAKATKDKAAKAKADKAKAAREKAANKKTQDARNKTAQDQAKKGVGANKTAASKNKKDGPKTERVQTSMGLQTRKIKPKSKKTLKQRAKAFVTNPKVVGTGIALGTGLAAMIFMEGFLASPIFLASCTLLARIISDQVLPPSQ